MTLKHVAPGDPLSATRWNEMVDRLNNTDLTDNVTELRTRITVCNTNRNLSAGEAIWVSGMRGAYRGPTACYRSFVENGFQLNASTLDTGYIAVLEEALPVDRGSRAHIAGALVSFPLAAGFVYSSEPRNLPTKVKAAYGHDELIFADAPDGDWSVVGLSSAETVSDGDYIRKYFAYLTPDGSRPWVNYYKSDGNNEPTRITSITFGTGSQDVFQGARSQSNPSVVTITGAKYSLTGATQPVTNVTVDANGDIVLERGTIAVNRYF